MQPIYEGADLSGEDDEFVDSFSDSECPRYITCILHVYYMYVTCILHVCYMYVKGKLSQLL